MELHDSHVIRVKRHYLAEAIVNQRNEIRKTPIEQRRREKLIKWYDYTLRAEHWIALPVVQPLEAAMLLCQFNPDESTIDWMVTTNLETKPQDHAELLRQLQAAHALDPRPRTLRQWWELARDWKHHSWIDQYIEFTDRQAAPIDGTQSKEVIWPPERLARLQEHRDEHGNKKTALKFQISVSRVKQLTVAKTHREKATTLINAWNR